MKKIVLLFFTLAWCATAQGADRDLLTAEPRRITDEAISSDIRVMQGLQGRLAALNGKGVPIASYHFAKAQAWLDFAMDEYTVNGRSRVVEETLRQALGLIEQLESGNREIGMATPIIPTSAMVRPDLWEKAEALKKNADFLRCAGDKIAQLEVQLVWAGHEEQELGWRHSKPYLQAAERLAREADGLIAACPPLPDARELQTAPISSLSAAAPVPTATFPPAAGPVAAATSPPSAANAGNPVIAAIPPAASAVVPHAPAESPLCPPCAKCEDGIGKVEEPLPDRVHFALDRSDIGEGSKEVLDRVALAMKGDPNLRLLLHGHADQRGEARYNMKLSQQRAASVRSYLTAAGVAADRVSVAAYGKTRLLITEKSIDGFARNRRVEFIFSVGAQQRAVRQDGDLQPERKW